MNSYYVVKQRYYDNGKVVVFSGVVTLQEKPKNTVNYYPKFDEYCDFFDTKTESDEFKAQALKA